MRTPRSSSARRAPVPPSRGPDGGRSVGSSAARSILQSQPDRRVGVALERVPQGQQPLGPLPAVVVRPAGGELPGEVRRPRGRRRRERSRGRPTSRGPAAARCGRARSSVAAGHRPHRLPLGRSPAPPRRSRARSPVRPARAPSGTPPRPAGRTRRPAPRPPGAAATAARSAGSSAPGRSEARSSPTESRAARSAAVSTCRWWGIARWCPGGHRRRGRSGKLAL